MTYYMNTLNRYFIVIFSNPGVEVESGVFVCVRGRMSHQVSPSDSQHHHSARLVFFFFSISDLFSSCEKFLCLKNFHIFRNQTYQTSKQPDAETRTEIILQLGSEDLRHGLLLGTFSWGGSLKCSVFRVPLIIF